MTRPKKDMSMSIYSFFGDGPAYLNRTNEPGYPQGAIAARTKVDALPGQSILYRIKHPDFPEITALAEAYQAARFYTDACFGKFSSMRQPQDATLSGDILEQDGSNLALVVKNLLVSLSPGAVVDRLSAFAERFESIAVEEFAGTAQLFLLERGLKHSVSAARLSDGTLRFLCLLAILLHPDPPPLVCIEEPELGMHPDIIPTIAKLLIDASKRMQLIVTTHSDLLVSCLNEIPEAVLVCDRYFEETTIKRLDMEKLQGWLEEYSLGDAWLKGALGGTRW